MPAMVLRIVRVYDGTKILSIQANNLDPEKPLASLEELAGKLFDELP